MWLFCFSTYLTTELLYKTAFCCCYAVTAERCCGRTYEPKRNAAKIGTITRCVKPCNVSPEGLSGVLSEE